jgi:hypothetical protein
VFGLSLSSKRRLKDWWRREKISRALFHRFADVTSPGEARLWIKLNEDQKQTWLARAGKHVRKERLAGKELPYA